jgi:hypothetical protein
VQQDPTIPPPKKDNAYYVQKYGQYMAGRGTDEQLAGQTFQDATKPYKDLVTDASKKTGIPPELLFSSINEEGLRDMVHKDEYSGDDKYPISGYAHFGLDTFGDAYPQLVKKGYLPDNMDFSPQVATNEKGGRVHTANFKTVDDAIDAKAAMLKNVQDQVADYAAKKGYNLSDKSKNFFMLAAYNGGTGLAQKMMDSYNDKGVLQNDAYLTKKPSSYAGVYDNIMRRVVPAQAWKDDGVFQPEQTAQTAPQQTTQPTQTAQQGQPIYRDGKPIAYIVNGQTIAAN